MSLSEPERLWSYVETWHTACEDLVKLAREIPETQWHFPTDLAGWDVKDNVAHTAHLEAVLAGAPEETVPVPDGVAHVKNLTGAYTEQGVLARRGRPMDDLLLELSTAVATRYAALREHPPLVGAAAPPRTPGGIGWNTETLLRNRPLDVWMHEQDIRRAIGRPGGFTTVAAKHSVGYLADALPVVVGKRVRPEAGTSVVLAIPDLGVTRAVRVGDDGRAHPVDPSADAPVRITLAPQDFIVLAGGRRSASEVDCEIRGDQGLGRRVLDALAVTP
jgi:uncharacterized protein (TIGR03083 family)